MPLILKIHLFNFEQNLLKKRYFN